MKLYHLAGLSSLPSDGLYAAVFPMRLIRSGLFIGCKLDAEEAEYLESNGIKSILTVELDQPSIVLKFPDRFVYKFIQCEDDLDADLLSRLDECVDFISEGLKKGGVLVHCLVGVSRSSTAVLAYLMKSEKLTYNEAYNSLQKVYPQSNPNEGFEDQLKLYEAMGNKVDKTSSLFKQYRLQILASQIRASGHVSSEALAHLITEAKHQGVQSHKLYKCKKCRNSLFNSGSILEHKSGNGQLSFKWHKRSTSPNPTPDSQLCTSLFIEPVDWMMEGIVGTNEGKVCCPRCQSRLGSFNWAGMQCSCGTWMTPAFQFHKNKLDETREPQKNPEAT